MANSNYNIESPCVRNCCLNDDDVCLGCFRSLDEIRLWSNADDSLRAQFLKRAAERRGNMGKAIRHEAKYFEQLSDS